MRGRHGNVIEPMCLVSSHAFLKPVLGTPAAHEAITHKTGLVLVTGQTGSGKSTSLAAMIDQINSHRAENKMADRMPDVDMSKHFANLSDTDKHFVRKLEGINLARANKIMKQRKANRFTLGFLLCGVIGICILER